MNKKMSELFHEFVHDDELNGNDEIIRETNAVVAEDDIEVRTMLDDRVGEKYFYRCMELAENVIKSFEDEQSQLNDNQKIVLEWLQEHLNEDSDPLGVICGMQKFGLQDESIFDATFPMNDQEQFEILLAFAQWGLKQEGTE